MQVARKNVYLVFCHYSSFHYCFFFSERISNRNNNTNHQLLHSYQSLQMLNLMYNTVCKSLLPQIVSLLIVSHTIVSIVMIRGSETVPTMFRIMLFLGSIIASRLEDTWFKTAGALYESSLDFKSKVVTSREKHTRLIGKACQPLALRVGGFYKVSKSSTFTYFSHLSNFTITLLLY
jgi:hypothetical protein